MTFSKAVGGTGELDGLTVTGRATVDADISSNDPIVFNGTMTLGKAVALTSNADVTLNCTVDGNFALTVGANDDGDLRAGRFGAKSTPLASLSVSAGAIALDGGTIKTVGSQSYSGPTTLSVDTTLTSTSTGAIGLEHHERYALT